MALTPMRVVDGQTLEFFSVDNTYLGTITMNSQALKLAGSGSDVIISAGHKLVFKDANARLGGINSILTIGNSGDTIDLRGTGVTYNLPSVGTHSDVSIASPATGHILQYDATSSSWKNYVNLALNGGELQLASTAGHTKASIKSTTNAADVWVHNNSTTFALKIATNYDNDKQIAFDYTPGTAGAAAGLLKIGQLTKNNANWTHGITALYTNGVERMRIDKDGKVGIGASPSSKLHVYSAAATGTFADSLVTVLVDDAEARLQLRSPDNGSIGSAVILSSGAKSWSIVANDSGGGNSFQIAYRQSAASEDMIANGTKHLTITTDGKIGVNTAAPKLRLEVAGTNAAESGTATPNGALMIGDGISDNSQVITMGVVDGASNHAWIQSRNNSTANFYTLALNPSGGPVGIGTTTVTTGYLLEVNGAIKATGINVDASGSVNFANLTANRVLITNGTSDLAVSATTATEVGYLSGVTANVQSQINNKAPSANPTFSGVVSLADAASIAVVSGASVVFGPSKYTVQYNATDDTLDFIYG